MGELLFCVDNRTKYREVVPHTRELKCWSSKELSSLISQLLFVKYEYYTLYGNRNQSKFAKDLIQNIGIQQNILTKKISDLEESFQSLGKKVPFILKF